MGNFIEYLRELDSYIVEGIDIDYKNKKVKFNDTHDENVNTSVNLNPTYSKIKGIDVISIFKRIKNKESTDGSPLIHALKGNYGWSIDDESILKLFKNFIKISKKIKPEYDTIISIYSSSDLNNKFLYRLNNIIKCQNKINDLFTKLTVTDIYEDGFDNNVFMGKNEGDWELFDRSLQKMKAKGDYFTYKELPTNLRKYIKKSSKIINNDILTYSDMINGKDILILDDTISSGKSISDNIEVINSTFTPKSITVVTLFSAL